MSSSAFKSAVVHKHRPRPQQGDRVPAPQATKTTSVAPTTGGSTTVVPPTSTSTSSSTSAFVSITYSAKEGSQVPKKSTTGGAGGSNSVANSDAVRRSADVNKRGTSPKHKDHLQRTSQPPPQLTMRNTRSKGVAPVVSQPSHTMALQPSDPNTYEHQQRQQAKPNKFPINNCSTKSNSPPGAGVPSSSAAFSSWSVESTLIPATQPTFHSQYEGTAPTAPALLKNSSTEGTDGDEMPNPPLPGASATYCTTKVELPGPPPSAPTASSARSDRPPLPTASAPFRSLVTGSTGTPTTTMATPPTTSRHPESTPPTTMKSLLQQAMVLAADSFFMVPATSTISTAGDGNCETMALPPSLNLLANHLRNSLAHDDVGKVEHLSRASICHNITTMLAESPDRTFQDAQWLTEWNKSQDDASGQPQGSQRWFTQEPLLVLDQALCQVLSLSQTAVQAALPPVSNGQSPLQSPGTSPLVASMVKGLSFQSLQNTPTVNANNSLVAGGEDADRTVGPKFNRLHRLPSPGNPPSARRFTPTGSAGGSATIPAQMPDPSMDLHQQSPPVELCVEIMRQVYSIAPTLKTHIRRDPGVAHVLTHRCCRYVCIIYQRLQAAIDTHQQCQPYSSFPKQQQSQQHLSVPSNYFVTATPKLPLDHPMYNLAHAPPICLALAIACYTAKEYSQNAFYNQQLNTLMITEGEAAGRRAMESGDPRYEDVSMWKVVKVLYKKHYHKDLRPLTSGKLTQLETEVLLCLSSVGGVATTPTVMEVLLNVTDPVSKEPLLAAIKCSAAARKFAEDKKSQEATSAAVSAASAASNSTVTAAVKGELSSQQLLVAALLDEMSHDVELQALSCSNDATVFLASSVLVAASL